MDSTATMFAVLAETAALLEAQLPYGERVGLLAANERGYLASRDELAVKVYVLRCAAQRKTAVLANGAMQPYYELAFKVGATVSIIFADEMTPAQRKVLFKAVWRIEASRLWWLLAPWLSRGGAVTFHCANFREADRLASAVADELKKLD